MLKVENITKRFGNKLVLDKLSLDVKDGEICGLVGVNGCGKSTLMKIICSLAYADMGKIEYDGRPIRESEIGYMIESPFFLGDLTARRNLEVLSVLFDDVGAADIDAVLDKVGLGDVKGKYRTFSMGMKQRLYFAYALLKAPRLLVLDEVFNGIDPVSAAVFKTLIKNRAAQGCGVLISGHNLEQLQSLCDRIFIVSGGNVAYTCDDSSSEDLEKIFLIIAGADINVK